MWRSLDELAETPEFESWLQREFPRGASEWTNELHRRDFLRLMGASVALAGLGACTKQPIEKIVPYVDRPEEVIPGKPLHFATATTFARLRAGDRGHEQRRAPDQDRGKSRAPGESRRHLHLGPGRRA